MIHICKKCKAQHDLEPLEGLLKKDSVAVQMSYCPACTGIDEFDQNGNSLEEVPMSAHEYELWLAMNNPKQLALF